MNKQVITLSDRAAERVKEIMASAKEPIIGVRVGVHLEDVLACLMLWNMQKKLIQMTKLLKTRG